MSSIYFFHNLPYLCCRQNMGRRYIEIFIAKRFDYYNAIAQNWEVGRHRR